MGNIKEGVDELKALGNQHTKYVFDYNPDVLEKIPNKHDDRDYFVKFNCPEFTSLCPKTGQPDFATIYISYIPDFLPSLSLPPGWHSAVPFQKHPRTRS